MMLRTVLAFFVATAFASQFATHSSADILSLYYYKTDIGGGIFQYDFTLSLTNDDNSYAPGQGFNWIIFGDVPSSTSTLPDFALLYETFPNPDIIYTFSGGGHNGPTFLDITNFGTNGWIPIGVGDSVTWGGTSAFDVPDGQLLFSTLVSINGATLTDFKVAVRVPEPASGLLAVGCLVAAACQRRRRR
ncbi:MAG TPA: hypothetical protein PKD64_10260 [Pirellulaceae bacterium]|nr:hypothetical protein [Pirellulaceae bacterium]HMO92564.1 hypothetical protein [Pirellulaceae bacterium]HMP70638.1 hypothetical protein [Pirellulaceae bacterium]